ncbi:MAG: response regulator [Planctomycetota bacterium]
MAEQREGRKADRPSIDMKALPPCLPANARSRYAEERLVSAKSDARSAVQSPDSTDGGTAASSRGTACIPTVLLVDHNRSIRDFCKRELEREGYRVFLAENGHKALVLLKQMRVDVLVVDVDDPEIEAFRAVTWVLIHFADLPVIVHTANRWLLPEVRNWPVEACIEKTHDLAVLKETIADIVARMKTENARISPACSGTSDPGSGSDGQGEEAS